MKKIFLILSASLGVLAHPSRQKRQEGELGLAKEGFPASKEVADGVYSFSNDGFYMSMFVVTQEGVMVVDPMNNNQAKVGTGEIDQFKLYLCVVGNVGCYQRSDSGPHQISLPQSQSLRSYKGSPGLQR